MLNMMQLQYEANRPLVDPTPRAPVNNPVESFSAGFWEGLNKEITATGLNAAQYWAMGLSKDTISKDEFDGITEEYGKFLQYEEGMTRSQAEFLKWNKKNEMRNMQKAKGISGMGGMFAGTFADPFNIGSVFVPVLRAESLLAPAAKYSPMIKLMLNHQDKVMGKAALGASVAFTEAAAREPFILAGQKYIQGEYDYIDSVMNLVAAPLFGASIGTGVGVYTKFMDAQMAKNTHPVALLEGPSLKDDPTIQGLKFELLDVEDRMGQQRTKSYIEDPESPKFKRAKTGQKGLEGENARTRKNENIQTRIEGKLDAALARKVPAISEPSALFPDGVQWRLTEDLPGRTKDSVVSTEYLRQQGFDPYPASRYPTPLDARRRVAANKQIEVYEQAVEGPDGNPRGGARRIINTEKSVSRYTQKDWEAATGTKTPSKEQIAWVRRQRAFAERKAIEELTMIQQDIDFEQRVIKEFDEGLASGKKKPRDKATQEQMEADIRRNGVRSIFYNERKYRVKGEEADKAFKKMREASYAEKRYNEIVNEMDAAEQAVARDPIMRARQKMLLKIKDNAYRRNSHTGNPKNRAQMQLAQLFKQTFGRDIRFFSRDAAQSVFEGRGLVTNKDWKTMYIMEDSLPNMMYVAGHEFAHTIKYQNPQLYKKLTQIIAEWDARNDGRLIDQAVKDVFSNQGDPSGRLTSDQLFEEAFNNVFGVALGQASFWRHMRARNYDLFTKLWTWLRELQQKLAYIVNGLRSDAAWPGSRIVPEEYKELDDMFEVMAKTLREIERDVAPGEVPQIKSWAHNAQFLRSTFSKYSRGKPYIRFNRWLSDIDKTVDDINLSNAFESWEARSTDRRISTMAKKFKGKTTDPIKHATKLGMDALKKSPEQRAFIEAKLHRLKTLRFLRDISHNTWEKAKADRLALEKEGKTVPMPDGNTPPWDLPRIEAERADFLFRWRENEAQIKVAKKTYDSYNKELTSAAHEILPDSPIIWRTNPDNSEEWEFYLVGEKEGRRRLSLDEESSTQSQNRQSEYDGRMDNFDAEEFNIDPDTGEISTTYARQMAIAARRKRWKEGGHFKAAEKSDKRIGQFIADNEIDRPETRIEFEVARWINDEVERFETETKGPWNPFADQAASPDFKAEALVKRMDEMYGHKMSIEEAKEWIQEAFWSQYARYDQRIGGLVEAADVTYDSARAFNADKLNKIKLQRGFWPENERPWANYYLGDMVDPEYVVTRAIEDETIDIFQGGDTLSDLSRMMDDAEDWQTGMWEDRMGMPADNSMNPFKKLWDRLKLKQFAENLDNTAIRKRFEQLAKWHTKTVNEAGAYMGMGKKYTLDRFTPDEQTMIENVAFGKMTMREVELHMAENHGAYSTESIRVANRTARWRRTRSNAAKDLVALLREHATKDELLFDRVAMQDTVKKLAAWSAMSDIERGRMYYEARQSWYRYKASMEAEGRPATVSGYNDFLTADINRKAMIQLQNWTKEEATFAKWKALKQKHGENFRKYVQTYFDGVWKKGLKPEDTPSSFDNMKKVQVTKDTSLWMSTVNKHNLTDELAQNDSGLFKTIVRYYQTKNESLLPQDPARRQAVKDLAEVIEITNKAQTSNFHHAGVDVRYNPRFWKTQRHNRANIVKDPSGWFAFMMANVDWERTWVATGRDLESRNTAGNRAYLEEVFNDIENQRLRDIDPDSPEVVRNMSKEVEQSRMIHFKDGADFDYDAKYGSGDPYRAYLEGIQRRAELTAIFNEFGPNPEKMFDDIMAMNGIDPDEGGLTSPRNMFDYAIGKMDDPVDGKWANRRSMLMQFANVAYLGFSGISGLVDIAHSISAMHHLGINLGKLDEGYWKALWKAHKRQKNAQATQYFRYLGAGADVVLNSASRRIVGDTPSGTLARQMNDFIFTANGLNYWTVIAQEAVVDILTRAMGEADFIAKHPDMVNIMEARYGITRAELESAQASRRPVPEVDGEDAFKKSAKEGDFIDLEETFRLSPDMFELENPALANKMRNFLEDWIRQGVIEPDATSQVWVRLGLRDGTPAGSMIRAMTQYMSFGMATYRKTYMRMLNGYGEQGFMAIMKDPQSRRFFDMATFIGWSLALGYVSMNLKEILRLREPIHFGNMNAQTAKRWAFQSGIAGPLSDFLWARDLEDVAGMALGPSLGAVVDVGGEVLDADIQGAIFKLERNTPFATFPVVGELRKRLISPITGQAYHDSQAALKNLFDQEPLFYNPD